MFTNFVAGLVVGACLFGTPCDTPNNVAPAQWEPIGTVYVMDGYVSSIEEECAVLITLDNGEEYSIDSTILFQGQEVTMKMDDFGTADPKDDIPVYCSGDATYTP